MDAPNDTPSHETIADLAIRQRLRSVRVALPGRIEEYNSDTQKATVQPLILEEEFDDLGNRVAAQLPVVTDVPIAFLGMGTWRITGPVKRGDLVWLVFASSSIGKWLINGGLVDPEDDRHHTLTDAFAIPGAFSFNNLPTDAPTDAVVIHADQLKLGGPDADDPIVRRSDLNAVVNDLKAHTHVVPGSSNASPNPGAFSTPACSPVVTSK